MPPPSLQLRNEAEVKVGRSHGETRIFPVKKSVPGGPRFRGTPSWSYSVPRHRFPPSPWDAPTLRPADRRCGGPRAGKGGAASRELNTRCTGGEFICKFSKLQLEISILFSRPPPWWCPPPRFRTGKIVYPADGIVDPPAGSTPEEPSSPVHRSCAPCQAAPDTAGWVYCLGSSVQGDPRGGATSAKRSTQTTASAHFLCTGPTDNFQCKPFVGALKPLGDLKFNSFPRLEGTHGVPWARFGELSNGGSSQNL